MTGDDENVPAVRVSAPKRMMSSRRSPPCRAPWILNALPISRSGLLSRRADTRKFPQLHFEMGRARFSRRSPACFRNLVVGGCAHFAIRYASLPRLDYPNSVKQRLASSATSDDSNQGPESLCIMFTNCFSTFFRHGMHRTYGKCLQADVAIGHLDLCHAHLCIVSK